MKVLVLIPTEKEAVHLMGKTPSALPECSPFLGGEQGDVTWALCGVGPAAAGITTARLLALHQPKYVLLAGIAGSYRGRGLEPGDLVQASREIYADLGFTEAGGEPKTLDDISLPQINSVHGAFGCRLPCHTLENGLPTATFLTVSSITNSKERANHLADQFDAAVENMEGAGVALACALEKVPFIEMRAISNWVGPRDPSSWRIAEPLKRLSIQLQNDLETLTSRI